MGGHNRTLGPVSLFFESGSTAVANHERSRLLFKFGRCPSTSWVEITTVSILLGRLPRGDASLRHFTDHNLKSAAAGDGCLDRIHICSVALNHSSLSMDIRQLCTIGLH